MSTFVFRTEDGRDIGFLLLASREGQWPQAGSYDCIFSGFPRESSLWDDPAAVFVMEHKGQEWIADVTHLDGEITVRIILDSSWSFELKSSQGSNLWRAERDNKIVSGTGIFL